MRRTHAPFAAASWYAMKAVIAVRNAAGIGVNGTNRSLGSVNAKILVRRERRSFFHPFSEKAKRFVYRLNLYILPSLPQAARFLFRKEKNNGR